jgi:acetoin utilization deacetylase AcuC-like enzyme
VRRWSNLPAVPRSIAILTHAACVGHDPGLDHPERPERLGAVVDAIRRDAPLAGAVRFAEAAPAREADLLRVHSAAHIDRLRAAAVRARRTGERVALDADTRASAGSWAAALAAAGCAVAAARAVAERRTDVAFAIARPPGHHAGPVRAAGFCLANNVAVAARAVQAAGLARRVLVVDWDAHHGDGTQEIFWQDPTVYVLSVHLADEYPGTGSPEERGEGAGAGTTRNVPLPAGTGGAAYRRALRDALDAALAEFSPDLVIVSAGFDVLAGDPEGGFALEPCDLHGIAADVLDRVGGRAALVLEGGYVPDRIGAGAVDVLRAAAGLPPAEGPAPRRVDRQPNP